MPTHSLAFRARSATQQANSLRALLGQPPVHTWAEAFRTLYHAQQLPQGDNQRLGGWVWRHLLVHDPEFAQCLLDDGKYPPPWDQLSAHGWYMLLMHRPQFVSKMPAGIELSWDDLRVLRKRHPTIQLPQKRGGAACPT